MYFQHHMPFPLLSYARAGARPSTGQIPRVLNAASALNSAANAANILNSITPNKSATVAAFPLNATQLQSAAGLLLRNPLDVTSVQLGTSLNQFANLLSAGRTLSKSQLTTALQGLSRAGFAIPAAATAAIAVASGTTTSTTTTAPNTTSSTAPDSEKIGAGAPTTSTASKFPLLPIAIGVGVLGVATYFLTRPTATTSSTRR